MNCPKCRHAPLDPFLLSNKVEVETCPACHGVFYDAAEMAVDLLLKHLKQSDHACPKCLQAMSAGAAYDGRLFVEHCPQCRGIWLDQGEIQKLRQLSGTEALVKPPDSNDVPKTEFPEAAFAAFIQQSATGRVGSSSESEKKFYFNMKEPKLNPGRHRIEPPVRVAYRGRVYRHFQSSEPEVSYVLGEFNWRVKVGDSAQAHDYVCPPYALSEDVSGQESVWSHGEYLEPEEVWNAFGLDGAPPSRIGVSPAQPNPSLQLLSDLWKPFVFYCIAAAVLFFLIQALAQHRMVFQGQFQYTRSDVEKSRVTDVFDVGGHTSNLYIETRADVENRWAYFSMALIDAETGRAMDFGREISYYRGYDSDGSWSEGSTRDSVYLPRIRPGRYYLRIEPESDSEAFPYSIKVIRDVTRFWFLFLAIALLFIPMIFLKLRCNSFEYARWSESDHPIGGNEDDGDED